MYELKDEGMRNRFWNKVAFSQAGCWEWTGAKSKAGYGNFKCGDRYLVAHRISYVELVGPLEFNNDKKGLELDHLCRNRRCVNPKHLELVLHRDNVLRGVGPSSVNAKKNKCNNGHDLSGDNLYIPPGTTYRKCRMCRECRKIQSKAGNSKRRKLYREEVLAYQRAWYAKNGRKKK